MRLWKRAIRRVRRWRAATTERVRRIKASADIELAPVAFGVMVVDT